MARARESAARVCRVYTAWEDVDQQRMLEKNTKLNGLSHLGRLKYFQLPSMADIEKSMQRRKQRMTHRNAMRQGVSLQLIQTPM
jgi:hypothetical protein